MNITRRQFGIGVLAAAVMLLIGRLFGCRRAEEPRVTARHWRRGDRLAG